MRKGHKIKNSRRNLFLISFVFMILLFFINFNLDFVQATEENKNILFISSYSESFVIVPDQIKGLRTVFEDQNINLEIEYMDTKRISSKENIEIFYNSLKFKLEHLPAYDAIIVGDDAALQFAMDHQEELFPNAPIVFFGINDMERAITASEKRNMAGFYEITSLVENIELANQLNPDAKKVVAIVDGTLTGQGDQKQFEAAKASFENLEFEVLNVSNSTFEEFGEILEGVSKESILLFLSMNQDITEDYLVLDKQVQFIKEHTKVPVYRASVGGVGDGLLGGKMISYEEIGKNGANLVMDIFSGKEIDSIALVEQTPYHYLFDYEIIQKYNIDESLIPKDATLINKTIHPFDKYKNLFLTVLGIVVFLGIVTVLLVFDNIKRRKMHKDLREKNEEITAIYEELTASEEELKMQCESIELHSKEVDSLYQKYNIAINSTNSAVWELNLDTKEVEISDNFECIINKSIPSSGNVFGILDVLCNLEDKENIIAEIRRYIKGDIEEINIQVPTRVEKGERRWILIKGRGIKDSFEEMKKISGIFHDITALKEQEEYIEFFASHDYLTYLPNRMNFMDRLSSELSKGARGAVLLLDIDDFKSINDTLGHVYGDGLLKHIAKRISSICDKNMFVARLGGDEFVILLTKVHLTEEIDQYIQKITNAFINVFSLDENENYINFSMGITCFPEDSDDIDQLIMNADTAMYTAKNNGKNSCVYYHEDMKNEVKRKVEIETILRHAVKENGFCLQYQPQVDVESGDIVGFEALLRLKEHAISPGIFIPIAEQTGHIIQIGRWVAKEAISQIAKWREKGFQEKIIAINYSSKQLRDIGFIDYIRELLVEYQVKAEFLEIEITEGILLENDKQTLDFLQELKKYGFNIALDDFGTGYSSLNYLTYIPVNKIKLDKSINDKFLNLENTTVMDSLISLAHSLNLKITAEGIEEWDKYMKLKGCGCDYIQGYLFSKPLSIAEVENIYNANLIEDNTYKADIK